MIVRMKSFSPEVWKQIVKSVPDISNTILKWHDESFHLKNFHCPRPQFTSTQIYKGIVSREEARKNLIIFSSFVRIVFKKKLVANLKTAHSGMLTGSQ